MESGENYIKRLKRKNMPVDKIDEEEITMTYDQHWKNMAYYTVCAGFLINLAYNNSLQKHLTASFLLFIFYIIFSIIFIHFITTAFESNVITEIEKTEDKHMRIKRLEKCKNGFFIHKTFIVCTMIIVIILYYDCLQTVVCGCYKTSLIEHCIYSERTK